MVKKLKPTEPYTRKTHRTTEFKKIEAEWDAKIKGKHVSVDKEIKTYKVSRPPETKAGFEYKHKDKFTYFLRLSYAIEDLRFYKKRLYPHLFRDETDEMIMRQHMSGESIRDIEEILAEDTYENHKRLKSTAIYDRLKRMCEILKIEMFEFNK